MKTIKVSEATNTQLDWLVAKCEKHEWRCPWILQKNGYAAWMGYERGWGNPHPEYTTDWSQMGPILERFPVFHVKKWQERDPDFAYQVHLWDGEDGKFNSFGPTSLIAAARCYVVSKLGEEVEVPEELA